MNDAKENPPTGYSIKVGGTITNLNDKQQRMISALLPGALWRLLVFIKPMRMPAIMELILLSGTVVNNSFLLLDEFADTLQKLGIKLT